MRIFKVEAEDGKRQVPIKAASIEDIISAAVKKLNLPMQEYQVYIFEMMLNIIQYITF